MRAHAPLLGLCLLAAALADVQAQSPSAWADPTRPIGSSDGAAAAPRLARAASGAMAAASAPAAPSLQSVQVGTRGEASALVDGRLVQAGDMVGALRVVAIDVDGLTLRDAKGRTERLNLIHPAIVKRDGGPERPLAALSADRASRQGRRP